MKNEALLSDENLSHSNDEMEEVTTKELKVKDKRKYKRRRKILNKKTKGKNTR